MRMDSGILAWNIATSAGVEWTVTWLMTDTGDPTVVYGIMATDLYGPYLFTALLKVSYQFWLFWESDNLLHVMDE